MMVHDPQMVNGYPSVCPNDGFGTIDASPCPTNYPWKAVVVERFVFEPHVNKNMKQVVLVGYECPFCRCIAPAFSPPHTRR